MPAVPLRRIQHGLERLYRLEVAPDVRAFLLDDAGRERARRRAAGAARRPREQIFVGRDGADLRVGLFVDRAALENLERRDPRRRLDESNLEDLLLAVEGVSHYLCVVHWAQAGRPLRALELELQAEVDKYVVCLLLIEAQGGRIDGFGERLAGGFRLAEDLGDEERARYRAATEWASAYVGALDRRFVRPRRLGHLLDEIRAFYRLPFQGKRERIRRLAARAA